MEDVLQRLMKESGSSKFADIANSANRALGEVKEEGKHLLRLHTHHYTLIFTNAYFPIPSSFQTSSSLTPAPPLGSIVRRRWKR